MWRWLLLGSALVALSHGHSTRRFAPCQTGHDARVACKWVYGSSSPYRHYASMLKASEVRAMYKRCTHTYCTGGQDAVCAYAKYVAKKCLHRFNFRVTGALSACEPFEEYCPAGDETDAELACSWINDQNGTHADCFDYYGAEVQKRWFITCVNYYCKFGKEGACHVADQLTRHCERDMQPVYGQPDICAPDVPTTTTEKPDGPLCIEAPENDIRAMSACNFVGDDTSDFNDCVNAFDFNKQKTIYQTCLEVYCERGAVGVCEFAENLAELCEEQFDITVVYELEMCPKPPTPPPGKYCTAPAMEDEAAVAACKRALAPDSQFGDCLTNDYMRKKVFYLCVRRFCKSGIHGVCELLMHVADLCEDKYGICIDQTPDICETYEHHGPGKKGHCEHGPHHDHGAHEACNFLVSHDSPYYACMSAMSCKKAHMLYKTCLEVYCEKGVDGVCVFASYLSEVCNDKFQLEVLPPAICDGNYDEHAFCPNDPSLDGAALDACYWILHNPDYAPCIASLDISQRSRLWMKCVSKYCNRGLVGVCNLATSVAGSCSTALPPPEQCSPIVGTRCCETLTDENGQAMEWVDKYGGFLYRLAVDKCNKLESNPNTTLEEWTTFKEGVEAFCGELAWNDQCPWHEPKTTPHVDEECEDPVPSLNAVAIDACLWIIDQQSIFNGCIQLMSLSTVKAYYMECVAIYCEQGSAGVCDLADTLADVCSTTYDITIESPSDVCNVHNPPPPPTEFEFCEAATPEEDEDAQEACAWLRDSYSSYYECYGEERMEKFYQLCLSLYCTRGLHAVCAFSYSLAMGCDTSCIDTPPNVCGVAVPDTEEKCDKRQARQECSYLLDAGSDFYGCTSAMTCHDLKDLYEDCIKYYCLYGHRGVCRNAYSVSDICQQEHGVAASLDDCDDPPVTGNITCDNVLYFYADGQAIVDSSVAGYDNWRKAKAVTIPAHTRVLAIKCVDQGVVAGILASFSDGTVTDDSWKCTSEIPTDDSWMYAGFDDAAWPGAHVSKPNDEPDYRWGTIHNNVMSPQANWIWTTNWERYADSPVYCRKAE